MAAAANSFLPSPAREDLSASESESEIIAELDRKRRQLGEEIAQFKTQKEKEFHDFEQDLRKRRKRKRSPTNGETYAARTPSLTPSVLSLLGSRPQANGHATKQNQQHRSRQNTAASRPTLSVEKLTILGTSAPPATIESSPNVFTRSLTGATTPPHIQDKKISVLPLMPMTQNDTSRKPPFSPIARDCNDPFAGVFTPAYLPLLDSRSSSIHPNPPNQKQTPMLSQFDASPQTPPAGSESSSLPSSPISPRMPSPAKRAHTAPLLPSTNLPSALRVSSAEPASTKKLKHVTFRLADSAVVEPSSSYEEMSSPDLPSLASPGLPKSAKAETNGIADVLAHEEVPWSGSKGDSSSFGAQDDAMDPAGDGYVDGLIAAVDGRTNEIMPVPDAGLSHDEAPDEGGGVGFFELEEELDHPSPRIIPRVRSPRSDRNRFFDDWAALVDEDEDDEMADDDDQCTAEAQGEETHTTQEEIAEEMPREDTRGLGISGGAARRTQEDDSAAGVFAAGSVPIDIVVRPSSSWVGSFGAGSLNKESNYVP